MAELIPFAVSIADACRYLSLGRTSLYAAIGAGKIKTRTSGRRRLVELQELHRFIASLPASDGS